MRRYGTVGETRDVDGAIEQHREAVRLMPNNLNFSTSLGLALLRRFEGLGK
jgi:hypothetical protein